MAEEQSGQERSEQPTSKRLDESRKKGQVARSSELNMLLVCLRVYYFYGARWLDDRRWWGIIVYALTPSES